MRTFTTGATKSPEDGKIDPEGFLSPLVIRRFCAYMAKHQIQSDGKARTSDNWQKGIPKDAYLKSGWRHFLEWWCHHRGAPAAAELEEALCALLFNVQGYLHETLKEKS